MRELTAGLHAMLGAMEKARSDMGRSGEDFAQRMTEAAENLTSRLVADAGQNLGQQSDRSRETVEQMLSSLREIFDQASKQIDANLAASAEGASSKLSEAMDRVLGQLQGQVQALHGSLEGFQARSSALVDETPAPRRRSTGEERRRHRGHINSPRCDPGGRLGGSDGGNSQAGRGFLIRAPNVVRLARSAGPCDRSGDHSPGRGKPRNSLASPLKRSEVRLSP